MLLKSQAEFDAKITSKIAELQSKNDVTAEKLSAKQDELNKSNLAIGKLETEKISSNEKLNNLRMEIDKFLNNNVLKILIQILKIDKIKLKAKLGIYSAKLILLMVD